MIRCVVFTLIIAAIVNSAASLSVSFHSQDVITESLTLDNAYHDAGSWGNTDQCANHSFVSAIEIRYQPPGNFDETAINAIKLYCTDYDTGTDMGYITSTTGDQGSWWGMVICTNDFVTGFRANTLRYQGPFVDDVAVENMDVYCNDGAELLHGLPIHVPKTQDFQAGEWSSFSSCTVGGVVCGIQTRYEGSEIGDETAIADITLYCCDRPS